jgi:hypothetical protein
MSKGVLIFKAEDLKSEIAKLKFLGVPALTLCQRAAIIAGQVII